MISFREVSPLQAMIFKLGFATLRQLPSQIQGGCVSVQGEYLRGTGHSRVPTTRIERQRESGMRQKLSFTVWIVTVLAPVVLVMGCDPLGPAPIEKRHEEDTVKPESVLPPHAVEKPNTELETLMKSAEEGDAEAQNKLGLMYRSGDGIEMNGLEAIKWFRNAAEQGYIEAQCNMGIMYDSATTDMAGNPIGTGIEPNTAEARKWFEMAAEQGNVEAQLRLGTMHEYGGGMPKNFAEALRWYRRAAEQGYWKAQGTLGIAYKYGFIVEPDLIEAYKWENLASVESPIGRNFLLELELEMDREEIAEAQRRSAEFKPKTWDEVKALIP